MTEPVQKCSAATADDLRAVYDAFQASSPDAKWMSPTAAMIRAILSRYDVVPKGTRDVAQPTHERSSAGNDDAIGAAQFLLDRLDEFDPGDDEPEREYHGHVAPAIARLRSALTDAVPQEAPVTELFEREGIARCLFYKAMKGHAQWDEMAEPHKDDWRVRADAWILDTTDLIEMSRSLRASSVSRPVSR